MNALDGLPSSQPLQSRIQERNQVLSQAFSFSLSIKTP